VATLESGDVETTETVLLQNGQTDIRPELDGVY
jgi:hypothetical protein